MSWFKRFSEIVPPFDDKGDYHDTMMQQSGQWDKSVRTTRLSSAWSRGKCKSKSPDKVVLDLAQIRNTVHNLLRVHGLPRNCRLSLACLGQVGKGAAGFEDIGTWKKPYIMLDAEIYKNCEASEVLDIYCGVGLHEASHILHTRSYFLRLRSGELKGERIIWEGLFEDERIENKVREESPGYSGYIQVTKRALFERREFGSSLNRWNEKGTYTEDGELDTPSLSDFDRINILIFAFIRCPHLLDESMKKWATLAGRCVFEELRELIPNIPSTEEEVKYYGGELEKWYNSHKEDYQSLQNQLPGDIEQELKNQFGEASKSPNKDQSLGGNTTPLSGSNSSDRKEAQDGSEDTDNTNGKTEGGQQKSKLQPIGQSPNADSGSSEITPPQEEQQSGGQNSPSRQEIEERLKTQQMANDEDNEARNFKQSLDELVNKHKSLLDAYKDAESAGEASQSKNRQKQLKEFEKRREDLEQQISDIVEDRTKKGRFGLKDLIEMMRRMNTVNKPLDKEESESMARNEELRVEMGPRVKPEQTSIAQDCIIIHPTVSPEIVKKYKNYYECVKGDIARMRSVFRFRLGTHKMKVSELKEGRLDRRRLGRAMQTDRLFFKTRTKTDKGLAIGILIDESGSMGRASTKPRGAKEYAVKAENALKVGILLSEALMGVPGIELEIYSFTTCGDADTDTLFKYLYGKNNKKKESIANYGEGGGNYDYQAIQCAVEQLEKWTTQESKLLIVVSDGLPCGVGMCGTKARELVKKQVDATRKKGIDVLQIAIDDFDGSEGMYGQNHVIHFTQMPELINNMRKFVTRTVKKL